MERAVLQRHSVLVGISAPRSAVLLGAFAIRLSRTSDCGGVLTSALLGGLFVVLPEFQLAINAFALQLLLKHAEGLVDVVVTYDDLHSDPVYVMCG